MRTILSSGQLKLFFHRKEKIFLKLSATIKNVCHLTPTVSKPWNLQEPYIKNKMTTPWHSFSTKNLYNFIPTNLPSSTPQASSMTRYKKNKKRWTATKGQSTSNLTISQLFSIWVSPIKVCKTIPQLNFTTPKPTRPKVRQIYAMALPSATES